MYPLGPQNEEKTVLRSPYNNSRAMCLSSPISAIFQRVLGRQNDLFLLCCHAQLLRIHFYWLKRHQLGRYWHLWGRLTEKRAICLVVRRANVKLQMH